MAIKCNKFCSFLSVSHANLYSVQRYSNIAVPITYSLGSFFINICLYSCIIL